jgi:hypothetical protein
MRFRIVVRILLGLLIAFSFAVPSFAEEKIEGEINWVDGYITAIGHGASVKGSLAQARPLARRAAIVDAQRNLLEIIKGVKIDSQTTVENFMVTQDIIKVHVSGVVKGASISKAVEYQMQPDGSLGATVEMRICVNQCKGNANSLVQALSLDKKDNAKLPPALPENLTVPVAPAIPPKVSKVYTYDSTKPVTGIILNLDGRMYERVILPVVVTTGEDKNLFTVYSAKSVKPNVIRVHGVVRYADTVDNAKKNEYAGNNVMVIPVADINKENLIIIKMESAKTVQETLRNGNDYLGDAKVFIVAQ